MSQYKAIPQPGDQRNVSQNDILTNFNYLSTPLVPGAGVANGIIPVDHFASGDNVANPTDGFHKQVSFQDRATPASLTNAINSQISSGILYSKVDAQTRSQVRYLNAGIDSPVTYLKSAVNFSNTGAILGNAFNATVVKNGVGNFTISFPVPLLNVNYQVYISSRGTGGSPNLYRYTNKLAGSVDVLFLAITSGTTIPGDPLDASVQVIGFF